ncbi:MAG: hypothetical protein LBQ54_15565 [Planctomycetaceae bacterium]|jgi:hypothetical protein|nr:hypothetical protein [Planctomycetaceae bacterium]
MFLMTGLLCCAGCDTSQKSPFTISDDPGSASGESNGKTPPVMSSLGEVVQTAEIAQNEMNQSDSPDQPVVTPEPSQADTPSVPPVEEHELQVGDDKRGHYGEYDYIAVPAGVYFSSLQRITIDQIKHSLDLYQALNGKYPETQEIFMKEIIEANGIKLPQLREGSEYVYKPETGKLMVRKFEKD